MKSAKRQSTSEGIFQLKEGDRLWKLWYSNESDGFQMRLVSIVRADGTLELAVISEGPSGRTWGIEKPSSDEVLIQSAKDWVKEMSDSRIQFRFLDLSSVTLLEKQFAMMRKEGLKVQSFSGNRRSIR